jgi:hypothetical protein
MASTGDVMGRVGKSYPRFKAAESTAEAVGGESNSAFQTRLGAIIGIVCALGLIAWLVAR